MDLLDRSPFLSASLVLMLLGGALVYLRRLPGQAFDLLERFCMLTLEIQDEDEAYQWMQVWLAETLKSTLSLSVVTRRTRLQTDADDDEQDNGRERSASRPAIYFIPAVGTYFFWYHRRLVMLSRNRRENNQAAVFGGAENGKVGRDKESFHLRLFSRDRGLARRLMEECRERAIPDDGKINIRVANYGSWSLAARVKPRRLESVVLDGCRAQELLADMRGFLAGQDWYHATGVPYRRGYLLYGPPGNGKSSVVKALASELGMSVYLLMLSDPDMNDNRISSLLSQVPDGNMLLLEDVDCAFVQRRRTGEGASERPGERGPRGHGLTFAGLLNALDGVAAGEGRIVVMTTNHVDRLDPALVRPGRADVKLEIRNATADQARRLFLRFFPSRTDDADAFAGQISCGEFSMAALQDYLMTHRTSPEQAVQAVATLRPQSAPTNGCFSSNSASLWRPARVQPPHS